MKFEKGNKKGVGRPKGSKNQFTLLKQRLYDVLIHRFGEFHDEKRLTTSELFRGMVALLPKEMKIDGKDLGQTKIIIISTNKEKETANNNSESRALSRGVSTKP